MQTATETSHAAKSAQSTAEIIEALYELSFWNVEPADNSDPLTEDAATAAAEACEAAVARWLDWMQNATEMKRDLPAGAKQTQTYTRDTKLDLTPS